MSLSQFRDSITAKLQDKVDALSTAAINMRVHPEMSSDMYAMLQLDKLAEARAFASAAKIVIDEYKRMTEAPPTEDSPKPQEQVKANIYG